MHRLSSLSCLGLRVRFWRWGAYRGERSEAGADSELPELFDVRGERGESIRALEPRREPLIGFFPEGGLRDMAGGFGELFKLTEGAGGSPSLDPDEFARGRLQSRANWPARARALPSRSQVRGGSSSVGSKNNDSAVGGSL